MGISSDYRNRFRLPVWPDCEEYFLSTV